MQTLTEPRINEQFDALASTDLPKFRGSFRRMHKIFPAQAAEACLLYIAAHGLDPATKSMAYWLTGDATYISVLLDLETLPVETAVRAVAVVKDIDPQFYLRFVKATAALESSPVIIRALGLLTAMGDYSILIPWLRSLGQSSNERVRARSAKFLCELRPNKSLIERQAQSNDPRIRAGAMEALWQAHIPEAVTLFQAAVKDANHRVAANALVGLHRLGENDALSEMIELCKHKDHLFRAAAAWALGSVKDVRAIPVLQELSRDRSHMVRKRALASLLAIESANTPEDERIDVELDSK